MDENLVIWHFSIVYVGIKGNLRFMFKRIPKKVLFF